MGAAWLVQVGLDEAGGCSLTLGTYDRSGNRCVVGGAQIELTCVLARVSAYVTDHQDGNCGRAELS